jgi:hypothetical protein
MGRPGGKKALGRPRRRWEAFIRMDPEVIAWGDTDWIAVAQGKDSWLVIVVMNLGVS